LGAALQTLSESREPLCRMVLGSRSGKNRSFGATILDNNFGEQLWGAASGNSFGKALDSFPE